MVSRPLAVLYTHTRATTQPRNANTRHDHAGNQNTSSMPQGELPTIPSKALTERGVLHNTESVAGEG